MLHGLKQGHVTPDAYIEFQLRKFQTSIAFNLKESPPHDCIIGNKNVPHNEIKHQTTYQVSVLISFPTLCNTYYVN